MRINLFKEYPAINLRVANKASPPGVKNSSSFSSSELSELLEGSSMATSWPVCRFASSSLETSSFKRSRLSPGLSPNRVTGCLSLSQGEL